MHDAPKDVWTSNDFELMGWHDVMVHAIAFEPAEDQPGSVYFDIDYLFEWVGPTQPNGVFTFWVAPATLVFPSAWDVTASIQMRSSALSLQINDVVRTPYMPLSGARGLFRGQWGVTTSPLS